MDALIHIDESTLPGAGLGLFVNDDHQLTKGDYICEYEGELIDIDLARSEEYQSDYLYQVSKDWVIDAQHSNSFGKYINDPIVKSKMNCKIKPNKKTLTAEVFATKTIKANSEIFVSYGEQYWMHTRHYDVLTPRHQKYLYRNSGRQFQKWVDDNYDI